MRGELLYLFCASLVVNMHESRHMAAFTIYDLFVYVTIISCLIVRHRLVDIHTLQLIHEFGNSSIGRVPMTNFVKFSPIMVLASAMIRLYSSVLAWKA
jgi:hypothetical protein